MTRVKPVRASVSRLSHEDVQMLLHALHIAFEDGSIYGGYEDDSPEGEVLNERGDALRIKLIAALRKTMITPAPPPKRRRKP
jgi:hypothetical protein